MIGDSITYLRVENGARLRLVYVRREKRSRHRRMDVLQINPTTQERVEVALRFERSTCEIRWSPRRGDSKAFLRQRHEPGVAPQANADFCPPIEEDQLLSLHQGSGRAPQER